MRRVDRSLCRLALLALPLTLGAAGCMAAELAEPALKPVGAAAPTVAAGANLLLVVGGDNRPTQKGAPLPPVFSQILQEVGWIHPDLVVWSGDSVYGYCDSRQQLAAEYDAFQGIVGRAQVPLYNAPGNHEVHEDTSRCSADEKRAACAGRPCAEDAYRERFGGLYGSFNAGDVHFIALDAEQVGQPYPAIDETQMKWLRADLEAHKDDRAIFVFSHSEFYSSPLIDFEQGLHHPSIRQRAELQELFRLYPVAAVFSGHEHLYWHEPPENHDFIHYFVAGGAGAPLYAPPDRGGFAHYLVVQVTGSGRTLKVTYRVVEPGHLAVAEGASGADGDTLWFANGNDLGDLALPVKNLRTTLAAGRYGSCADVKAGLQKGFEATTCSEADGVLTLVLPRFEIGSGRSLKLWVGHRKS